MSKITARFIIEISGKPQENVEKALEKFKNQFEEEKEQFTINSCSLEEPEYSEESKLYSGFLEVDAVFGDISDLLNFIADYNPTSIEIEEPSELSFDSSELAGILNDISSMILKANVEKHKLRYQVKYLQNQLKSKK